MRSPCLHAHWQTWRMPTHASTPKRSPLHRLMQRLGHWAHLRGSATPCPWGPYAEQRGLLRRLRRHPGLSRQTTPRTSTTKRYGQPESCPGFRSYSPRIVRATRHQHQLLCLPWASARGAFSSSAALSRAPTPATIPAGSISDSEI